MLCITQYKMLGKFLPLHSCIHPQQSLDFCAYPVSRESPLLRCVKPIYGITGCLSCFSYPNCAFVFEIPFMKSTVEPSICGTCLVQVPYIPCHSLCFKFQSPLQKSRKHSKSLASATTVSDQGWNCCLVSPPSWPDLKSSQENKMINALQMKWKSSESTRKWHLRILLFIGKCTWKWLKLRYSFPKTLSFWYFVRSQSWTSRPWGNFWSKCTWCNDSPVTGDS